MHNGLSGLYNRFRGVVGGGKDKSGPASHKGDNESIETASVTSQNTTTPASRDSIALKRDDSGATVSPIQLSTPSSRLQSPTAIAFAAHLPREPTARVKAFQRRPYIHSQQHPNQPPTGLQ